LEGLSWYDFKVRERTILVGDFFSNKKMLFSRILYPNEIGCSDPAECLKICGSEGGCSNIAYPKLGKPKLFYLRVLSNLFIEFKII